MNYKLRSLLKGFSTAFDITGTAYLPRPNLYDGFRRDGEALRGDWRRIGNDMRKVMGGFDKEVSYAGK
jgi:hypothetical protein